MMNLTRQTGEIGITERKIQLQIGIANPKQMVRDGLTLKKVPNQVKVGNMMTDFRTITVRELQVFF